MGSFWLLSAAYPKNISRFVIGITPSTEETTMRRFIAARNLMKKSI